MTRMFFLGDVLRDAGLKVVATNGWQSRGKDSPTQSMNPRGVVAHHTASGPNRSPKALSVELIKGRPDRMVNGVLVKGLPGPLCHLQLERDGSYWLIASGKANHCGAGVWKDANRSTHMIGIEAANLGNSVRFPTREPWPIPQLEAYDRGVAALLAYIGRDQTHFCGHREWALPPGRKPDPSGIDLDAMRSRVGKHLDAMLSPMTSLQARLEVAAAWHAKSGEWMTSTPTETRQARLTRLAYEVVSAGRKIDDIILHAPAGQAHDEPVSAWVLDPTIPQ